MNIVISKQKVETNNLSPFTPVFDMVFVSTDDDFEDNNEFKLTEKNMKKLFNVINFSWDGEIYWFKKEVQEQVLSSLEDWFKNEENHVDIDDCGISNCFLIKETPNGLALIDTQLDMSSNITDFLQELSQKHSNIDYLYYSDCHLIDHMYLGRGSINNEFEDLYLLYKENIIDASFLFNGLLNLDIDDEDGEYYQLLPKDKDIVITGKFPVSREMLSQSLIDLGINVKETVNKDSWLWTGEKVGQEKINKAKEKGCLVSSIDELVELAYKNYLKNKK